ncbi:MAG: tight adherence protein, partial [Gaiellaceae bacterium]|nr:tight adherence protein [Gaiellaceae bacterium]
MSKKRLLILATALVALVLPAATGAAVQLRGVETSAYPTIRASVVSASGARVAPVLSENGSAVAGLQMQNLGRAKAIVLAIDRSQSMRGRPLADASLAARSFVGAKHAADEVAVVSFGAHTSALSPFSTAAFDGDSALTHLKVDTSRGTALYDSVVLAARLAGGNPLPGRVIIVLSDGADNASRQSLQAAILAARTANAAVYTIGIEGTGFTAAPLEELSSSTGGQYYGASSSADLKSVYATIADVLKRTWRVQYVTAARPGDRISLTASVIGEGSSAQGVTIPAGGGSSAPPEPSKLVPKNAYGPTGPLALAAAVAFLVLLACLFFLKGARGSWVRGRIAAHTGEARGNTKQKRKERRSQALASLFKATEGLLGNLKHWRTIGRMLERADVPLKTVEFFWIMVGSAVGFAFFATLFGASPIVTILGMLVAASLPFGWVWLKMRRRLQAFEDQLPDLLITIAASLKAGHSFKQGLQAVVDEGHPPANVEIRRVLTETSLGRPMDDALAEMAERLGSNNFEFAITAVTIQRQVGGSLATLFDMVADTVRQRQQFARKIRALTAMGRMSAYTLVAIPFLLAGGITVINGDFMHPLYHTHVGQMLILLGLGMMSVGSLILKKI